MGRIVNVFFVFICFFSLHGCFNLSETSTSLNEFHRAKSKLPDLHDLRFNKPQGNVDLRTFITIKVQGANRDNKNNTIQVIRSDNKKAILNRGPGP